MLVGQIIFTSGCTLLLVGTVATAGIAGTAWYLGSLSGDVKATPPQVEKATIAAFKKLNYTVLSSTSDAINTKITEKSTLDDSIKVTGKLLESGQTEVTIRVGTFGDQAISVKLMTEINTNL